jgi:ribose-phosphate pyrophosphokinase
MQGDADGLKVFTGRANPQLAQKICDYLQIPLGRGRTELFPDGELIVKVEEDVRGRDCFIIQPTSHPINAHLMELMIWIDCLKRASAERVTAVIPYFGYARQDRKDEGRTPITAKLVANLIERSGADRVVAVDLHAAQVQGFFDIPVDHLSASPVIIKWFKSLKLSNRVFVSPDVGNVKRAQVYANILGGDICIIDKRRKSGSVVETKNIIGDVEGKNVLMVDDMITTAGTARKTSISQQAMRSSRHRRWIGSRPAHSRDWPSPTRSRSATAPMRSKNASKCSAFLVSWARRSTASITTSRSARYSTATSKTAPTNNQQQATDFQEIHLWHHRPHN